MGVIEKIAVDSTTLARLEKDALAHGRSVEEAAELLHLAVVAPSRIEMLRRFDESAAMTVEGVKQTDSTLLIRQDRDSR